jgi:hypothetical protein
MILLKYDNLELAWHGLIQELAYGEKHFSWQKNSHVAFAEPVSVEIADVLDHCNLSLGMASFSRSRWTSLVKKYFRPDLKDWVKQSVENLLKFPEKLFICGYQTVQNEQNNGRFGATGKHRYGACLHAVMIQLQPRPTVTLQSRLSLLDGAGFCDLVVFNRIAEEMARCLYGPSERQSICGVWFLGTANLSYLRQAFYVTRFHKSLKGHQLAARIREVLKNTDHTQFRYGLRIRILKRVNEWRRDGMIAGDKALIKDLSIGPEVWKK